MSLTFVHFDSATELQQAIFDLLAGEFSRDTHEGPYAIMLSGGSTPLDVYRRLSETEIDAPENLHLMLSDDRHVSVDSPDSNYGNCLKMAEKMGLKPQHFLHIDAEKGLDEASNSYGEEVRALREKKIPLKVALLGIGADGHTASIFSLEAASIRDREAFPVRGTAGFDRVSVSSPVIEYAGRVIVMASGEGKRDILEKLKKEPATLPSGNVFGRCSHVEVWTDSFKG